MKIYEFTNDEYVITGNNRKAIYVKRQEPSTTKIGTDMTGFMDLSKKGLESEKISNEYPFLKEFKNIKKFIEMDSEEFIDKFPELFI